MTHQSARAQEGGFVALPFFFCKCHNFKANGQALLCLCQFLNTGNGHINTQAAIVLAAIANGVEMAAGHEVFGARYAGVIATHDVANSIDIDFVKACQSHGALDAF